MPRTGITAYDLLISCPGDVLQYAEIVKECVESFNHTLGCINNVLRIFSNLNTHESYLWT